MDRYYFNVRGDKVLDDEEGCEYASEDQAREEAIETCGEMIRDLHARLAKGEEWRMEVANEQRKIVFVIRITVEKGPG
jgi:hypothetical protein